MSATTTVVVYGRGRGAVFWADVRGANVPDISDAAAAAPGWTVRRGWQSAAVANSRCDVVRLSYHIVSYHIRYARAIVPRSLAAS